MKKIVLLVVSFILLPICWWYSHYSNFENYSPALQNSLNDFSKFLDVDGVKEKDAKWWSIYYTIPSKDFLWAIIHHKLFPLIERCYSLSSNKIAFLQLASKAFKYCSEVRNSSLKNVCDHYLYDLIGPKVQISQLFFSELRKEFSSWKELKERSHELDFDEHYLPLDHKNTHITQEYALGEHLLGIGITPESSDTPFSEKNFVYLLKAGNTHRQPFVSIVGTNPTFNFSKARFWFINQKLSLFLPAPQRDENVFYLSDLTPQYELQKDGSRKLKGCFEEKEVCIKNRRYQDCKTRKKKLPLKRCENLWATLKTVL